MVTRSGAEARAGAEADIRSALATVRRLGRDHGLVPAPSRVVATFDERGLLTGLEIGDGDRMTDDALRADIERAIAGRIPPRLASNPAALTAWLDGVGRRPASRFTNDLGSVTVQADLSIITGLSVSRRLLGGARPQTVCDEVLPVARLAQLESDELRLLGGSR